MSGSNDATSAGGDDTGPWAALLCIVGLEPASDPTRVRADLARLAGLAGEERGAALAEIRGAYDRRRSRELWRARAEVESICGAESVAAAIAAGLAVEWCPKGRAQLVPTPRAIALLGVEAVEHSRVQIKWPRRAPREDLGPVLDRVYYQAASGDAEGLQELDWDDSGMGRKFRKRGRDVPDQIIRESDRWEFPAEAAMTRPRVPTQRGTFPLAEDFEPTDDRAGPVAELIAAEGPPRAEIQFMGCTFLVDPAGPIARAFAGEAGRPSPREAMLLGGLGKCRQSKTSN